MKGLQKYLLFFLVNLYVAQQLSKGEENIIQKLPSDSITEEQLFINETLQLINEGDGKIALRDEFKDIVLVVGLTGAGKSTISKFIAEPENLEAYDTGYHYLIRDNTGSISENSTVVSKTIFPELITDPSVNYAYYDLPGFSDTRNTSIELANAWFMKKVANHASSVKIMFVVDHSTVKAGEHRDIILAILSHATDFIKDPKKFANSISLVVSKVEDESMEIEDVVQGVADFLVGAKGDLSEVIQEPEKRRATSDLIDAFLSRDAWGAYNRISFFKQPESEGPLTAIPSVMQQWAHIKQVVENNTVFVKSCSEDFGISVSPRAQLLSMNLTQITSQKITAAIVTIQEKIHSYYTEYVAKASLLSVGTLEKEFKKLQAIPDSLRDLYSRKEFLHQLTSLLMDLEMDTISSHFIDLRNLGQNLEFFENVTGKRLPFDNKEWSRPIGIAVQVAKIKLDQKLAELNTQVSKETGDIAAQFQLYFADKLKQPKNKLSLLEEIQDFSNALKSYLGEASQRAQTFNGFSSQLKAFLSSHGASVDLMLTEDISVEGSDCKYLSVLKLSEWIAPFKGLHKHLRSRIQSLEIQVHDEKLQQDIQDAKSDIMNLEKNATEKLNNLQLERANLQIEINKTREVWEAKLLQQQETCQAALDRSRELQAQKLAQIQGLQAQLNSSYQLEINQEKQKAEGIQAKSVERLEKLNRNMEEEREQHSENMREVQRFGDGLVEQVRLLHEESVEQASETCAKSLAREQAKCTDQLVHEQNLIQEEKKSLEEKLTETEKSCAEEKESKAKACNLRKEQEGNMSKRVLDHLKEDAETKRKTCLDQITAKKANCESQVARFRSKVENVKTQVINDLEKEEERCKRLKDKKDELHIAEARTLEAKVEETLNSVRASCETRIENARSPSGHSLELQKFRRMAEDSERDTYVSRGRKIQS